MNPTSMTNERLCALAQKGDETARELLVEKNMGFIVQTADLVYRSSSLEGSDLNIDVDDLVRDAFSRYEQRMVDSENGPGLQKVRLDEVLPGEERLLRMEAVADIAAKSPEQVYEERETLRELYKGLGQISEREQAYLLYRHGFADDIEHTLTGAAIHFHLSENRAKKLEDRSLDTLRKEMP